MYNQMIQNDFEAEMALVKLKEAKADTERQIEVCNQMIQHYETEIKGFKMLFERKETELQSALAVYFENVEKHKTKTMESYTLPSGKLVKKYSKKDYKCDEKTLLEWLKKNEPTLVKTGEEKANWKEFKSTLSIKDDKVITADGEVLDFIKLEDKPETFNVEL
jgi:hypothetical protein